MNGIVSACAQVQEGSGMPSCKVLLSLSSGNYDSTDLGFSVSAAPLAASGSYRLKRSC